MRIVALCGKAGAGKDTFADRLVERHGFVKRGFADPLYEEVAEAYGIEVAWLRDRTRKEVPQAELALSQCGVGEFWSMLEERGVNLAVALSPRQVLQWWGTDFRRSQSDTYWIERMEDFVDADFGRRGVVIPDCRFMSEAQYVSRARGCIVRILRPGVAPVHAHASEIPLPDYMVDRTVHNAGSVSYLHSVADSLIRGAERIAPRAGGAAA